jgi:general stress protein 26
MHSEIFTYPPVISTACCFIPATRTIQEEKMKNKHPQAPPFENELEIETFLVKPLLARFCSHNPDGSIHITPIYYLYENGEFLFGTQKLARKVRNIQRDNRVTVLIDAKEPILQAAIIYGEAVLDFEDVLEKRVRILERYYESPSDARIFAEKITKAWKTVIIHVRPSRMVTFDYSKPFTID